jgi:hypothetical protein
MNRHLKVALCVPSLASIYTFASGNNYKNFGVATHARVRDVLQMSIRIDLRFEGAGEYGLPRILWRVWMIFPKLALLSYHCNLSRH